jgi:glycosyltransferase involved in cell wall biosynthesis
VGAPLISVILPVFNGAPYLEEALRSILRQTEGDWELIAVDDGSTDDTPEILKTLTEQDKRIRLIQRDHEGIVAALCLACSEAKGNLLARMDADDIAEPTRFAEQADLLRQEPEVQLCSTRVQTIGSDSGTGWKRYERWINARCHHDDIVRELFVECPLPHPGFMMRRLFYEKIGGYRDRGWPEDYDLVMRAWQGGARFAKPDPILLRWREHPERLSKNDPRYTPKAFRQLKRHFLSHSYLKRRTVPFIQWGAGEVGKRWLREWPTPPQAVVDIHPRKVGRIIHGVRVIPREALPAPGQAFVVIAVGARGARSDIRHYLGRKGYEELRHYLFIA